MAYVARNLDDDEEYKQNDQPVMIGGAAPSSPGMSSFGTPARPQTPQQQKGTGFTNLNSWLDAGKGRDASITSTGTQKIGAEKDTFNAAAKPVEDAQYNANLWDTAGAEGAVSRAADSGNVDELTKSVSQSYAGPRDIKYDPHAQKNLWDADALTSADTAGRVLAAPATEAGQYGAGAQALDKAIFGADAASQQAMSGVKQQKDAFAKDVTDRSTAAGSKIAGFDTAAANANAANTTALKAVGDRILGDVDRRVADEKAQEAATRKWLDSDPTKYVSAQDNGQLRTLAPGETRGAVTGGGATRENTITDQESKGVAALNKAIGTPTVQKTGTYAPVSTTVAKDPNYVAPLPSRGDHEPRAGTVMNMLPGDINDPNSPKGSYAKAYLEFGKKYAAEHGHNLSPESPEWKQFFDDYQRAHPEVKLPTGEEADAYEASAVGPNAGTAMRNNNGDPAAQIAGLAGTLGPTINALRNGREAKVDDNKQRRSDAALTDQAVSGWEQLQRWLSGGG